MYFFIYTSIFLRSSDLFIAHIGVIQLCTECIRNYYIVMNELINFIMEMFDLDKLFEG